jgi:hypothetical protein
MKTTCRNNGKKKPWALLSAHGSFPLTDGHDGIRQTFKLIKLKK